MIFDADELGADAMPSPLTAAVVQPHLKKYRFLVTYDIGGRRGALEVYATNWRDAQDQATCDIEGEAYALDASITVKPMP